MLSGISSFYFIIFLKQSTLASSQSSLKQLKFALFHADSEIFKTYQKALDLALYPIVASFTSSTNMSVSELPAVRYHTVVHIDSNGNAVDHYGRDTFNVYHVTQVIRGTLDAVLHLIGYSFAQIRNINAQLSSRPTPAQSDHFELSLFDNQISAEIKNSRPARAHIVQFGQKLYGVIVDGLFARICGHIDFVIPNSRDRMGNFKCSKGVHVNRMCRDGWMLCGHDALRRHIVLGKNIVAVAEKGALFIVPLQSCSNPMDNKLLLVLGNGFAILDETPTAPAFWIRTNQKLRDYRRQSNTLKNDDCVIVSFAAIAITEPKSYSIFGNGNVVALKQIQHMSDPF